MKVLLKLGVLSLAILIMGLLSLVICPPDHFRGYGASDWSDWIATLGDHPGTRFAPGFSEAQFAQIKVGMTRDEVRKVAGKPLYWIPWTTGLSEGTGQDWSYSDSVTNVPNYHVRDVMFDSKGRVVEIWKAFYAEGEHDF